MKRPLFLGPIALALALPASGRAAEGLPAPVLAALKAAQIPPASVAVVVHPVDSRFTLVSHNARQAMNPASVMKLVTTYAALDLLGPAWTWKTSAYTEADPALFCAPPKNHRKRLRLHEYLAPRHGNAQGLGFGAHVNHMPALANQND